MSILPASVTHCASLVLLSASFLVRGNTIKRKGQARRREHDQVFARALSGKAKAASKRRCATCRREQVPSRWHPATTAGPTLPVVPHAAAWAHALHSCSLRSRLAPFRILRAARGGGGSYPLPPLGPTPMPAVSQNGDAWRSAGGSFRSIRQLLRKLPFPPFPPLAC